MSTAKLFPRATTRSDTRASACVTIYMHFGNTSPEVKTRVAGLSVQRSLRIWYQNYTACGGCVRRTGPAIRRAYETSPTTLHGACCRISEHHVEVIGLGLRDAGAWHVPSTSRCYGVCPNYVRRNVTCAKECGFSVTNVEQGVQGFFLIRCLLIVLTK